MRTISLIGVLIIATMASATFAVGEPSVFTMVDKNSASITELLAEMRAHGLTFIGITDTVRAESKSGSTPAPEVIVLHALALKRVGVTAVYRDETLDGYRVVTSGGVDARRSTYAQKGLFIPSSNAVFGGAEVVEFRWRDGSRMSLKRVWREWYEFSYETTAP